MRSLRSSAAWLALCVSSACTSLGPGLVFTDTVTPTIVLDRYPLKMVRVCGWSILGLVAIGDVGARRAMAEGKFGRVALIDTETQGALGIFRICHLVYAPYGDLGPPPDDEGTGMRKER